MNDPNLTPEQKEAVCYALRDAEKYWRKRRQEAHAGEDNLYSEEECTEMMKKYRKLQNIIEPFWNKD